MAALGDERLEKERRGWELRAFGAWKRTSKAKKGGARAVDGADFGFRCWKSTLFGGAVGSLSLFRTFSREVSLKVLFLLGYLVLF